MLGESKKANKSINTFFFLSCKLVSQNDKLFRRILVKLSELISLKTGGLTRKKILYLILSCFAIKKSLYVNFLDRAC